MAIPQLIRKTKIAVKTPSLTLRLFLITIVSIIILMSPDQALSQQTQETLAKKPTKDHSPTKASIYSAVLPGLGQAYNKKYWKIPIIYAGFGVMIYFIVTNTQEYKLYKEAYVYTANNDSVPTDNPYVGKYTLDQLEDGMNTYRKWRDISYIVTGLWYVLNVLDANVDAHLFTYDISDDLSLKWQPTVTLPPLQQFSSQPQTAGIRITLNF
jgi:hypothetical protein